VSVALIDDHLLGQVLLGEAPKALASKQRFTTGCWYLRLCQAVLAVSGSEGSLSRPFIELPPSLRERALHGPVQLPDNIGSISLRDLAPAIARLCQRHRLNMLSVEALAAASQLDADVHLSVHSPPLGKALKLERLRVRVPRTTKR